MEQFSTCDNVEFKHPSHSTNTNQRNSRDNQHSYQNIPVLGLHRASEIPDNSHHGSQNIDIPPNDFPTEQTCQNPNTQNSQSLRIQALMPPPPPPPNLGQSVPNHCPQPFSTGLQTRQFDCQDRPFPSLRHPSPQFFPDRPTQRFPPPGPMTLQYPPTQRQCLPYQSQQFSLNCQPLPPFSNNFDSSTIPLHNTSNCDGSKKYPSRDEIPISSSCSQRAPEKVFSNSTDDETEKFIQNWVQAVKQRKDNEKTCKRANQVKISCIQRKLLRYASITQELECLLECFALLDQTDSEEWENLYMKVELLKCEAQQLKHYFEDEKNIQKIQDALQRRRGKRQRAKRSKKKRKEERKKLQQEWKEEGLKIDKRLEQLHREEKAKISEDKMKKEADSVLKEVTAKQEETRKMRELFRVLSSLREARLKKGDVHGFVSSPQASSFFSKLKDEFEKLIPNQLGLYESEKHTLKVMLEESQNLHSEEKEMKQMPNLQKLKNQTYEILFGKYLAPSSLNEYQRSFAAADESVEVLVNRRTDWDQYLVPEQDPTGSSVPIGWVVPNANPNSDWKQFLVK